MVVAGVVVAGLAYWAAGRRLGPAAAIPEVVARSPSCPSRTPLARPRWSGSGAGSRHAGHRPVAVEVRASGAGRAGLSRARGIGPRQADWDEKAWRRWPGRPMPSPQASRASSSRREAAALDLAPRWSRLGPDQGRGTSTEVFALVDQLAKAIKGSSPLAGPVEGRRGSADQRGGHRARRAARLPGGRGPARNGANQDAVPLLEGDRRRPQVRDGPGCWPSPEQPRQDPKLAAADRAKTLAEKSPLPVAERYQIHAIVALVKEHNETAAQSYGEPATLPRRSRRESLGRAYGPRPCGRRSHRVPEGVRAPQYGRRRAWDGSRSSRDTPKRRSARCRTRWPRSNSTPSPRRSG